MVSVAEGHPCGHNEAVVTRHPDCEQSNLKGEKECWWICGGKGFPEGKKYKISGDMCGDLPRFPKHRNCQDLPWAILFLLTVVALAVYVAYFLMSVSTGVNADSSFQHLKTHDHLTPQDIKSDAMTANLSCIVGCVGGLLAAFLWVMMARACPGPVVYISCPEGKKYNFWGDMCGDLTSILGFK